MLDVFKGRISKDMRIVKVCSVGYGYHIPNAYELQINGFAPNIHILKPEASMNADNDYVLYQRSPYIRELQPVGVGYLMSEHNAGLIRLEWDIYGSADIYLDLSKLTTERSLA